MTESRRVNLALLGLPDPGGGDARPRINHIIGGGKIAGTGRWFESLGITPLHAWLASLTEVFGGAMLVLGLFTPLACAAVIGVMLVARSPTTSRTASSSPAGRGLSTCSPHRGGAVPGHARRRRVVGRPRPRPLGRPVGLTGLAIAGSPAAVGRRSWRSSGAPSPSPTPHDARLTRRRPRAAATGRRAPSSGRDRLLR